MGLPGVRQTANRFHILNFYTKGYMMKIKVYLAKGYRIINVSVSDSVKEISKKYGRWEYVL